MQKTLNIKIALVALALVLTIGALFFQFQTSFASITTQGQGSPSTFKTFTFFASTSAQSIYSTTTSATSTNVTPYFTSDGTYDNGAFNIAGAESVTFYFSRDAGAGGNAGASRFRVQVTPDGTNWYDYNRLNQNVASSTGGTTFDSFTISAATSTVMASMTQGDAFYAARCIVLETTDGSHSCIASANW